MNSVIREFPGYMMGALEYPAAVRHHEGDNFVKSTDGRIYNCHPQHNGVWPIRFEIKTYDGNYTQVLSLFEMHYRVTEAGYFVGFVRAPDEATALKYAQQDWPGRTLAVELD